MVKDVAAIRVREGWGNQSCEGLLAFGDFTDRERVGEVIVHDMLETPSHTC